MNLKNYKIMLILLIFAIVMSICSMGTTIFFNFNQDNENLRNFNQDNETLRRYVKNVSLINLMATPERYDNVHVRVIGVGAIARGAGSAILLSKSDYEYSISKNGIGMNINEQELSTAEYDRMQSLSGYYVIVQGVFKANRRTGVDTYPGTIEQITRYEKWYTED